LLTYTTGEGDYWLVWYWTRWISWVD